MLQNSLYSTRDTRQANNSVLSFYTTLLIFYKSYFSLVYCDSILLCFFLTFIFKSILQSAILILDFGATVYIQISLYLLLFSFNIKYVIELYSPLSLF